MRVLGIDTSLRSTGVGIVDAEGTRYRSVHYGLIRTPAKRPVSECLVRLARGLRELIETHKPEAVAIEGIFFSKNARTAVRLGEARGAAISTCADFDLPVYEYEPRRVKMAVVGHGGADKAQVQKMIASMLGLDELPPPDAADALAIAICHLHNHSRYQALQSTRI